MSTRILLEYPPDRYYDKFREEEMLCEIPEDAPEEIKIIVVERLMRRSHSAPSPQREPKFAFFKRTNDIDSEKMAIKYRYDRFEAISDIIK